MNNIFGFTNKMSYSKESFIYSKKAKYFRCKKGENLKTNHEIKINHFTIYYQTCLGVIENSLEIIGGIYDFLQFLTKENEN